MLALALLALAIWFGVINPILAPHEMRCPVCYDPIAEDEEVAQLTKGPDAGKYAHPGCVEEVEGE